MKRLFLLFLLGLVVLGATILHMNTMHTPAKELRIGYTWSWKTIHPGLQHTAVGDLVLSNQFDSLVGTDETGALVPIGARAWEVSDDFRVFTFVIDSHRRFSDGVPLKAEDYKRSWESALALEPKSANSSLQDVLYRIEGFEKFGSKKSLDGIQVLPDGRLQVRFSKPFRMALEHLAGCRFAAFREEGGKFLGTGRYVISEIVPGKKLRMIPNPFSDNPGELVPLTVVALEESESVAEALSTGRVDALPYLPWQEDLLKVVNDPKISIVLGQDAGHFTIAVNGLEGRLFQNPKWRQAFQFLCLKAVKKNPELAAISKFSSFIEPQSYLPLQAGRLDEAEAWQLVAKGEQYVAEFIEATNRHPIVFVAGGIWLHDWLKELSALGIRFSEESRVASFEERIKIGYKSSAADLMEIGFSVAHGDPDGLYHVLGRNGAILYPMTYRESVSELLESGRKIIERDQLHPHYQNVSRAILLEVPYVHLKFNKALAIYRNDRVTFNSSSLRRNEGHLDVFVAK